MTTQLPSTIVASDIDVGNSIVEFCAAAFTDSSALTTAEASTKWRGLGILKDGATLDVSKTSLEFYSGFPAKTQQVYFSSEEIRLSGTLLECPPRKIALALGSPSLSETVYASSPSPATVATGSTKTLVNFSSATGYAVDDEIRVGTGSYQYGRIQSIATNAVTLYEGLSGDANPTTGHAIAKIKDTYFDLGDIATPANIALRLKKTMVGGYGSYIITIPNAQMDGNMSATYQDNQQNPNEGIGFPFVAKAISKSTVESGKTARWRFTQS